MYIYTLIKWLSQRLAAKSAFSVKQFMLMIGVPIALIILCAGIYAVVKLPFSVPSNLVVTLLLLLVLDSPDLFIELRRRRALAGSQTEELDGRPPAQMVASPTTAEQTLAPTLSFVHPFPSPTPSDGDPLVFDEDRWGGDHAAWVDSLSPQELAIVHQRAEVKARRQEDIAEAARGEVDEYVYWDEHPGIKYFLKRMWRIVLAWLVALTIIAVAIGANPLVYPALFAAIFVPPAIAFWYTLRRIYKWKHMRTQIIGNFGYIDIPIKRRYLLLGGERQRAHLMYFNNVTVKRTIWENLFGWKTATVKIETSIPNDDVGDIAQVTRRNNDKFRWLTDVKRPDEFAELVSQRNDEITRGLTPLRRIGIGNPGSHTTR